MTLIITFLLPNTAIAKSHKGQCKVMIERAYIQTNSIRIFAASNLQNYSIICIRIPLLMFVACTVMAHIFQVLGSVPNFIFRINSAFSLRSVKKIFCLFIFFDSLFILNNIDNPPQGENC